MLRLLFLQCLENPLLRDGSNCFDSLSPVQSGVNFASRSMRLELVSLWQEFLSEPGPLLRASSFKDGDGIQGSTSTSPSMCWNQGWAKQRRRVDSGLGTR